MSAVAANGTTAGVAGVEVLVAGQPLAPTLAPLLQEVRVEDNLTLPDAFLLRISDPGLKHIDSNPLEVGSEIEIRIGGPDAKLLTTLIKGQITAVEPEFRDDGVRFVYRSDLFPPDFRPGETKLRTTSDLSGLPLGAFLDTVLRDVEMSWIARPEYIEIGPNTVTSSLRYQEKVTRVFDVADLIIGIPQSVNPATLYSSIQFQGAFMTIFGSSFVPQFGFAGNGVNPFAGGGIGGMGGMNNPFAQPKPPAHDEV